MGELTVLVMQLSPKTVLTLAALLIQQVWILEMRHLACRKHYADTFLAAVTNGRWSSWDAWTACSVTCGQGTRSHMRCVMPGVFRKNVSTRESKKYLHCRTCTNPAPANGGTGCPGSDTFTQNCFNPRCPVDPASM